MKWLLLSSVLLLSGIESLAQSKVVPASKIDLTGTELPTGSKRDQRLLPVSAANVLLGLIADKVPCTVLEGTEVYILPPGTNGTIKTNVLNQLQAGGWLLEPMADPTDFKLSRQGITLIMYLTEGKREGGLYLTPVTTTVPSNDTVITTQNTSKPNSTQNQTTNTNTTSSSQTSTEANRRTNTSTEISGSSGSYAFVKTQFDDGWVSDPGSNKVIVTKNSLRVFIYFGVAHSDASRGDSRLYSWQNIVGRDFQILTTGYRDNGESIASFQNPYVEGEAIENATGRKVYLGMYTKSESGVMFVTLAIAPDMNSLRTAFPKGEDNYNSDLHQMRYYNRFAIAASDLVGHWAESSGSSMNYYNVYSGNYAGTAMTAASNQFWFLSDGTYKSKHAGGFGMVGNMKVYQQEYKGNMTVAPWTISLTNRWEGKTDTFNAYFEIIAGGRVLHFQDQAALGITYTLVRTTD